jgi:2-polyprenyl-3-methyl-5-hydroxy-6-metoxy-1,4-benzoquinol methylase
MINETELKQYADHAIWYHTIKISPGIKTRGIYNHEKYLSMYGFPDLKGKTVLDVGCADGYFAFEFEKRGAKRVVAVDSNKYDGQMAISPSLSHVGIYRAKYKNLFSVNARFKKLAWKLGCKTVNHTLMLKKLFNSEIEFKNLSIYDLHCFNQKFDLVFCGDLIEHLKNPLEAVEQLRFVCRDTCIVSLSNPLKLPTLLSWFNYIPRLRNRLISYHGDAGGTFFHFHPEAFKKVLLAANFKKVTIYSQFNMRNEKHHSQVPHVVYICKI